MDDPFQAHAFFALTFECAVCHRELSFESHTSEFTHKWFRDLASHAKRAGWLVPPADERGYMDVMTAWCPVCGPYFISPPTALEPTREGTGELSRAFRLACASDTHGSALER